MTRHFTDNVTLLHHARKGIVTPEMEAVARAEGLPVETVVTELARGQLVIPANINHRNLKPCAIGRAATVKINANIGNSALSSDITAELEKVDTCVTYGADALMDLSTGGDINVIRQAIVDHSPIPVGTVPLYQAAEMVEDVLDITAEHLLKVIEMQARQGGRFHDPACGFAVAALPHGRQAGGGHRQPGRSHHGPVDDAP